MYPVQINLKETWAEISDLTPHRENITTVIFVNTRTKHLSGAPIRCEHAAELTNEQNNGLNLCVLLVYSMTFCYFYTVHLSQPFLYISAVHMNCEISAFGWCWHSK